MFRFISWCLFAVLVSCYTGSAHCGPYNEGMIDDDLRYQDFNVANDGTVHGMIVNTSSRIRRAVKLDMWITNVSETRIYWRKALDLGDMVPGARYVVREPSKGDVDTSIRLDFHFRVQRKGEFRNEGRFNR